MELENINEIYDIENRLTLDWPYLHQSHKEDDTGIYISCIYVHQEAVQQGKL